MYLILESAKIHSRWGRQHAWLMVRVDLFACSGGGSLAELVEVDLAITVSVGQVHHLGDNIVGNVLAEATKKLGELILGDHTIFVFIENGEGLLELFNLLSGELGHLI